LRNRTMKNDQRRSTSGKYPNSGRGGRPWRRKRDAVARRDGYQCQQCSRLVDNGECDHITPLSAGGTDDMQNLQWLCVECHAAKSAREALGGDKLSREERRRLAGDHWSR